MNDEQAPPKSNKDAEMTHLALPGSPTQGLQSRGAGRLNWQQAGVLADRYLDTILADWKITLLLLAQAPMLAFAAVMVWGNVGQANKQLYFFMVLICIWLGCMAACREIVKERALFLRERMFNLEVGAYLVSKLKILLYLNIIQVVLFVAVIDYNLDLRAHPIWTGINLLAVTFCGTCLGLLVSALSKRSDHAVGLVLLVIVPQILFSEFAIKKDDFAGFSGWLYLLMPSRWGYESLWEFAQTSPDYGSAILHLLPLLGLGAFFVLIAYPILRWQKF